MLSFESLAQFRAALGGVKKWDRTLEAIEQSGQVPTGVAYSVGDSLTWMKITGQELGFAGVVRTVEPSKPGQGERSFSQALTASRRYVLVVYCQQGTGSLEWAPVRCLEPVSEYSDLTDRQFFVPLNQESQNSEAQLQLQTFDLKPGALVIFDTSEAARLRAGSDFTGVTLRVTVEGHSFHNK